VLLGAIIQKVTGKSYEAVLKELILIPLKMSDSGIEHREVILDRRAAGYSLKGGAVVNATFVDLSWGYSAGRDVFNDARHVQMGSSAAE